MLSEEYEAAIDILNKSALSEQAKQIVEAPAVIAALYCGAYDQNDQLRLNRNGRPIGKNFVCNKILQMKPNPYREQTAMLLRSYSLIYTGRGAMTFPRRQCFWKSSGLCVRESAMRTSRLSN
jgi:hypothetical protein